MPIHVGYKEHAIHATAWQLVDSGQWEPRVTVIEVKLNIRTTLPNINLAFPKREEAEKEGLLFAKK